MPFVNFIIVGDPGTGKESLLARMSAASPATSSSSENWNANKQNGVSTSYRDAQMSNSLQKSDALLKFTAIPISDKHAAVEAGKLEKAMSAPLMNDKWR